MVELEDALQRVSDVKDIDINSFGSWSVSKLKVAQKCHLQLFLKYVLDLRLNLLEDPDDTLARNTGTTLHYILELLYNGYRLEEAILEAKEKYLSLVTPERWFFVEKHFENVQKFFTRMAIFGERYQVQTVDTELKIAVTKDWKPVDFSSPEAFFRGVVDLSLVTGSDDAIIIDHKRGGSAMFGLKYHRMQLNVYAILYHFGIKKVRGVQSGIHFIEAGSINLSKYIPAPDIEEVLPNWLIDTINAPINAIQEKQMFDISRGNHCMYCEYKDLCKGGKRGSANKLEELRMATKSIF